MSSEMSDEELLERCGTQAIMPPIKHRNREMILELIGRYRQRNKEIMDLTYQLGVATVFRQGSNEAWLNSSAKLAEATQRIEKIESENVELREENDELKKTPSKKPEEPTMTKEAVADLVVDSIGSLVGGPIDKMKKSHIRMFLIAFVQRMIEEQEINNVVKTIL